MKQNTIILVVILLLVVGGGSFATGYKIASAKNQLSNIARNNTFRGNNQNGQGNIMRGNNRQTIGEIISLDDKTMTIKMPDGSSKIILLSSTMTISKSVDTPKTELKVGSNVAVFGTNNTDGSQTATSIELDPKFLGQTQIK